MLESGLKPSLDAAAALSMQITAHAKIEYRETVKQQVIIIIIMTTTTIIIIKQAKICKEKLGRPE